MTRTLESAIAATHKEPSKKQVAAGNYRKGKCSIHGLTISIENPAGTVRKKGWKPLAHHYGYILRTEGRDGEHLDCFIGPNADSEIVFVVDQQHASGRFDEHKAMIGFTSKRAAKKGYLANYPDGWNCGPITAMTVEQFKAWLEDGDTKSRVEKQVSRYDRSSGMPAQPKQKMQVGQTKSVGGVTYRLNENHRWELADHDDPEAAHSAASQSSGDQPQAKRADTADNGKQAKTAETAQKASGRPTDDTGGQQQRQQFVSQQLNSVDPGVRGLMAAIHESDSYKQGGEFVSFDVNPKVAQKLYDGLRQHAGKTMGGGQVVDLGQGRIGFASGAGSLVIWPADETGRQRVSYTNRTGVVTRAMTGQGGEQGQQQPQAEQAPQQPEPESRPETIAPESSQQPEQPSETPKPTDHASALKYRDDAASRLHDALDEYEADLESGELTAEENRWHKSRISMLRQKLTHAKGEVARHKPQKGGETKGPKSKVRIGSQEFELTPEEQSKLAALGLAPQQGGTGQAAPKKKAAYLEKGPQAKQQKPATPKPSNTPAATGTQEIANPEAAPQQSPEDKAAAFIKKNPQASVAELHRHIGGERDAARAIHEKHFPKAEVKEPTAQEVAKKQEHELHQSLSPAWKAHAKEAVAAYPGLDVETYSSMAKELFDEYSNHHNEQEAIRRRARQLAGLKSSDINRLEDKGLDSAGRSDRQRETIKGATALRTDRLDDVAKSLRAEYPQLGWEDDNTDKLWEMLKEPARKPPSMLSEDFQSHLHSYLDSLSSEGGRSDDDEDAPKVEYDDSVPFRRSGQPLRYSFESRRLCRVPE